jgi:hypothetical protein
VEPEESFGADISLDFKEIAWDERLDEDCHAGPKFVKEYQTSEDVNKSAEVVDVDSFDLIQEVIDTRGVSLGVDMLEPQNLAVGDVSGFDRFYIGGRMYSGEDSEALKNLRSEGRFGIVNAHTYLTTDAELALAHVYSSEEVYVLEVESGIFQEQDLFLDLEAAAFESERGRTFLTYGGIPGQYVSEVKYFQGDRTKSND